jgi:hypothetical protein
MRDLASFRGIHTGETVLVCGCGESLVDLTARPPCVTIGVNDVGRHFQPDYLVVVNPPSQFSAGRYEHVTASRARFLFTQLSLEFDPNRTVRFPLGTYEGADLSNPEVLHYTQNSPYVAVCLAAHMGARRIGLLGVDFTDRHFFAETGRHPLAKQLATIDNQYRRLAEALQARGVELINLSSVSRLTSLAKSSLNEWLDSAASLSIVSYATTPVAGVPLFLARCINAQTAHRARCVWATNDYGNGVTFERDIQWKETPTEAEAALESADVVIVHNGKVDPAHAKILAAKPVITMAHNYRWNVDAAFVDQGMPGVVVAQYQATLAEFSGWTPVPNPIPIWEEIFRPAAKPEPTGIAYTPSGTHERYAPGHPLYWHSKGYSTTTAALERLASRHKLRLQLSGRRMLSHTESLRSKQTAHITIDECVTGSYHRNSLEGLAVGCVVVNGLSILPELGALFREITASDTSPFVTCSLETLESTLGAVIDSGPAALEALGCENRLWMERHWNFADQWMRFWAPVVERALGRTERLLPARHTSISSEAPLPITIVIPQGGVERLPLLAGVLGNLRKSASGVEIIVSEMDETPRAESLCAQFDCEHLFTRTTGIFHKTRAMNLAIPLANRAAVLFLDNDLLFGPQFLSRAMSELRAHCLDSLAAATGVRYLSRIDSEAVLAGRMDPAKCRAVSESYTAQGAVGGAILVRREFLLKYGGFCEEFVGWGGEDNAWIHKCRVLGRAAPTRHSDQHVYHLFHDRQENPRYQQNVELLRSIRALGTREVWLTRYPCFVPAGNGDGKATAEPPPRQTPKSNGSSRNGHSGVSLVVCHGGEERLQQLRASLANFRQCHGIDQIIVVEMGERPFAESEARRWADRYLFLENRDVFERARTLNAGTALAERDLVLWTDNDLLMPSDFASRAVDEMRARELDYLLPYTCIHYLSPGDTDQVRQGARNPGDCVPVRVYRPARDACGAAGLVRKAFVERYGGIPEEFRGWGGEDNAWWLKVRLLGRAAVTQRHDQPVYHLYHSDSGAYGSTRQMSDNPHYAKNVSLLREMRAIRDPKVFLERFPPQPPARPEAAVEHKEHASGDQHLPVWMYWEGECPEWIRRCHQTIAAHGKDVRLLSPSDFDRLRDTDRDIDLARLEVAHRADFIRAFLLARYGGLWIDSDCIVMQSLEPTLEGLESCDFLAHRERSGWVSNGFIGSRKGGRIASELYARLCHILRSRQPLGWITLGSEPLTAILNAPPAHWHELECERVQPVCWSHPEEFFAVRNRAGHESVFDSRAICYMLSNVAILRYLTANPSADLMAPGAFFSYLIDRSLRQDSNRIESQAPAAAWRQIPFCLGAVEEIEPESVLEVGENPGRWTTLIRDFCEAGQLQIEADRNIPDSTHWALILMSHADGEQLTRSLSAADYVLIETPLAPERNGHGSAGACLSELLAKDPLRTSVVGASGNARGAFLFSKSDPKRLRPSTDIEAAFAHNVEQCRRVGDESLSGPGSCLYHTAEIRQRLPLLIQDLGVRTMIDAPCGDFNWMRHVSLALDHYIGVDLIGTLIDQNRNLYGGPARTFLRLDLTRDPLPSAGLIFCRDCLVHLSFDDVRRALRNFQRSGSTYLLTTTFVNRQTNVDVATGGWRPLNLQRAPFHLPEPIRVLDEKCSEGAGKYTDKSLGLWRLADLRI